MSAASRSKLDFSDSLPLERLAVVEGRMIPPSPLARGGDPSLLSETARLGRFTNSDGWGSR